MPTRERVSLSAAPQLLEKRREAIRKTIGVRATEREAAFAGPHTAELTEAGHEVRVAALVITCQTSYTRDNNLTRAALGRGPTAASRQAWRSSADESPRSSLRRSPRHACA